jgi:hypothetical protein
MCLFAARSIMVDLLQAEDSGFAEMADRLAAGLRGTIQQAKDALPREVRQAILEANSDRPVIEWLDYRHATAHDAAVEAAEEVVAKIDSSNPAQTRERLWEIAEPAWPIGGADIEKEAVAALRYEDSGANNANISDIFPAGPPDNRDLVNLACRLLAERGRGKSDRQIAREYTGEGKGRWNTARSLLAQISRMEREGALLLPKRK